jgi:hypothetical protein
MQKYFTKEYIQAAKVIVIGLALGLGVSFVSANWTPPLNSAPTCNAGDPGCDAPINVSTKEQGKAGLPIAGSILDINGLFSANNIHSWSDATVGDPVYHPNSLLKVFGDTNVIGNILINKGLLTVDRTTQSGSNGRNLLNLIASADNDNVGIIQNKPNFFLWDYSNNDRATLQAKNVQLQDGSQAEGKVLTASDDDGLSAWGTLTVTGGTVDIQYISVVDTDNGNPRVNKAYCPAGYKVIGGGGDCQKGQIRISRPIVGNPKYNGGDNTWTTLQEFSTDTGQGFPSSNADGWMIACSDGVGNNVTEDGDIHVDAICMKSIPPVVTSVINAPQQYAASWHYAGSLVNATSSICSGAFPTSISGHTVTNWGYVKASAQSQTQNGTFNLSLPATPTNVVSGQCATSATPYHATASHLPTGQSWVVTKTEPTATYVPADDLWQKSMYATVLYY